MATKSDTITHAGELELSIVGTTENGTFRKVFIVLCDGHGYVGLIKEHTNKSDGVYFGGFLSAPSVGDERVDASYWISFHPVKKEGSKVLLTAFVKPVSKDSDGNTVFGDAVYQGFLYGTGVQGLTRGYLVDYEQDEVKEETPKPPTPTKTKKAKTVF